MSVLAALTIIIVVGSYAVTPALAHNGHSHGAAVSVNLDVDIYTADEVALALAELISTAQSARDGLAPTGTTGPARDGKPPCDGHCCTMGGTPCCGYMPVGLQMKTWVSVIDLGSTALRDSVPDGLDPESILRPPKSFA